MTATTLYRISAGVLVLFAAGHTVGFLKFKPPTPEGVAVQHSMDSVTFQLGSQTFSYGDFYRGFGLFCTLYLLFAAYLAWYLSTMAQNHPQNIGALSWIFFVLQVASIAVSWKYFIPPPVIFSAILSLLQVGPHGWRKSGGLRTAGVRRTAASV